MIIPMWLVCVLANQHETFTWKDTISVFLLLQDSAKASIRWGGKLYHLLIAYFLSNVSAKYYENPTMLPRVIAKTLGCFFETQCISSSVKDKWITVFSLFFKISVIFVSYVILYAILIFLGAEVW